MNKVLQSEKTLLEAIAALEADYLRKDFFRVVVLGPQLMVAIVDLVGGYFEDWAERKGLTQFTSDEIRAFELMQRLHKTASDKLIIAGAFHSIFESERDLNVQALANFESAFSKLHAIFEMRNLLAHEFYLKKARPALLRASASGVLDLLNILRREIRDEM